MNSLSPIRLALLLAVLSHAGVLLVFPPAVGPDWSLYLGSALELTRDVIRNPYILMDRNGYYPWLAWVFLRLPGQITSLVVFQHLVCAALTVWSVGLVQRWFDRLAAYLACLALTLCLPLTLIPQVTNSEAAVLMAFWLAAASGLELGLRARRGLATPLWLWVLFCLGCGLSVLARLSGLILAICLFLGLWLAGAEKKKLLVAVLGFVLAALPVPMFNYLRLGYFGTEFKAGRTLFAVTWQEDKSLLTSNGPQSRRLVRLLRRQWPRLARENPVIRKSGRDINQILDNPREFPYHLYYLIVNLTRREMPYKEADRLLRDVALEAFAANPTRYLKRRWQSLLAALAGGPPAQTSFLPPREAARAEARFYAGERRFSYRGVSGLYQMPGYAQTPAQVKAFHRDFDRLTAGAAAWSGWRPGLKFFHAWFQATSLDYKYLYGFGWFFFIALLFFPARLGLKHGVLAPLALFGALEATCLGNWSFVYLISAGRVLHALSCLAFELILAAGGLWAALRLIRPAGPSRTGA